MIFFLVQIGVFVPILAHAIFFFFLIFQFFPFHPFGAYFKVENLNNNIATTLQ